MALFLSTLKRRGLLKDIAVVLCAVGSRKLGKGDDFAAQSWREFQPRLTIYGFDADPEACAAANRDLAAGQGGEWTEQHYSVALGEQVGTATLYVTHNPMCSSLLPPNEPLLRRFSGLNEVAGLHHTEQIETTTLDAYAAAAGLRDVDFLRVDVQGADLGVLRGAQAMLTRSVLAVQVEVEFVELYCGQPLFAEVDTFLRALGFSLFDLQLERRARATRARPAGTFSRQVLWGDAIYLRDLAPGGAGASASRRFKAACVADALGLSDHALELLEQLAGDEAVKDAIAEALAQAELHDDSPRSEQNSPRLAAARKTGPEAAAPNPESVFLSAPYQAHNRARQLHLATLGLPIAGRRVLEVGAGIGCHTPFFVERNCRVVITDARLENLRALRQRYPQSDVRRLDLDAPIEGYGVFEVVYCYGVLYHLAKPAEAIAWMAAHCSDLLLLETCVSFGDEDAQNPCAEDPHLASQAVSGIGCRPTRRWVFNRLKESFAHVYLPATQPNHEEFPLDWTADTAPRSLTRAVFIASPKPIECAILRADIPMLQLRS